MKLNKFQLGQLVLKYDGRNKIKPGKFQVKWVGPYQIRGNNEAIKLWMLDGKEVADTMNRSKLNVYHERSNSPSWTNN